MGNIKHTFTKQQQKGWFLLHNAFHRLDLYFSCQPIILEWTGGVNRDGLMPFHFSQLHFGEIAHF